MNKIFFKWHLLIIQEIKNHTSEVCIVNWYKYTCNSPYINFILLNIVFFHNSYHNCYINIWYVICIGVIVNRHQWNLVHCMYCMVYTCRGHLYMYTKRPEETNCEITVITFLFHFPKQNSTHQAVWETPFYFVWPICVTRCAKLY